MVDEVIAVGDAEFQRRCYEHFYKLRQKGTTIVIVTHGLGDVKSMCDEAAWLDHGSLRAVGAAPEIVTMYLDEVNRAEADRHERAGEVAEARTTHDRSPTRSRSTRVQVLGADGQPVQLHLTARRRVVLQVDYTMKQPVEGSRLRFAVATEQGLVVAASSEDQACVLPATVGTGQVRFPMPSIPFGPGDYLVSVDVRDADSLVVFDQADRAARLRVRSGRCRGQRAGAARRRRGSSRPPVTLEQPL